MKSTQLGYIKLYFTKDDLGKMCKLKDIDNLAITCVEPCRNETVEITIATPMDNVTTNRVKTADNFNNGFKRYREVIEEPKNEQVVNKNTFGDTIVKDDYYLSIDLNRNDENYAILFKETSDMQFKIVKFIKIKGSNLNVVADNLIEILEPYKNGSVITSNLGMGLGLIDCLKNKNFNNIINLDLDDLRKISINNVNLVENNDLLYELLPNDFSGKEQFMEFLELYNELKNIDIKMKTSGDIRFERKSQDIRNDKIITVFNALSKMGYTL